MNRRPKTGRARTPQRGFTLVELMIALLIGLFLMGGLLTLVQDNKRTFTSQSALAQLQDGERLAMTMMTDVIQESGYFTDPTTHSALSTMPAWPSSTLNGLASPVMGLGQSMTGATGAANPAAGDNITVRFATASGDGILNCMGVPNTTGAVMTYVDAFYVNASQQLVCNQNGTDYPLVNGVTNLAVLYGMNTLGTGNNVDTYMTAAQVSAAAAWGNVISVHLALTFKNPLYNAADPQNMKQYLTLQRQVSVMNQIGL